MPSYPSLDYTTLALAKVWTDTAKLPNSKTMRALYEKTVEERGGYGKYFFFFGPERLSGKSFCLLNCPEINLAVIARFTYLIGWLNQAAVLYGGKQVRWIHLY